MSAGGYDAPHLLPRRPSGNIAPVYDRPVDPMPRRSAPSPGPSRGYDRYVPPRSDPPFRDNAPNIYRPNNYRPDYSSTYYPHSPSSDAHGPLRGSDPDIWDRGSSWRPPLPIDPPNMWPERKPIPPSPTTSSHRSRSSRDDGPSRLFEPSDSWKQTHVDRSSRMDLSPADRYYDRRPRNNLDLSPDRPIRTDRTPIHIPGGDRYRPPPKRDSFPPARSDSYRPLQDNGWPSNRRDPVSPTNSHFRRDSGSFGPPRPTDHQQSPYSAPSAARKPSITPPPVVSPLHSPDWTPPNSENASWTYASSLDPSKREPPPRQPSRSSIASTHVSDRKSPLPGVEPSAPIPVTTNLPNTGPDAPKPLSQAKSKEQTPAQEPVPFGAEGVKDQGSRTETKDTPCLVPSTVPESTANVAINSSVNSHTNKLESGVKDSTVPQLPTPALSVTRNIPSGTPRLNGSPPPVTDVPTKTSVPTKEPVPAPLMTEPQPPQPVPIIPPDTVLEIAQPKPSPIPELSLTDKNDPLCDDIFIPPTTHSPSLSPEISAATIPTARSPPPLQSLLPKPEDIPPFSEAKTKEEALRIVVMTRLLRDRQSREERVEPVLMANQAIAAPPEVHPTATPNTLLEKMYSGQCLKDRMTSAATTKPLLVMFFEQRQAMVDEKVTRLREEYLTLHERWVAHCNALNEQQKTLASEQENQHSGRTTRRSTAFTDAVRSDFEMEQIIASLGNDDATDPNHLSMRNLAKIPDMISAAHGKVDYLFDDTAGLVENPADYFAPHTGIDDWMEEEKQIFIDKFAAFPKQFGIIADYLPNKTAAQCVDYYYLHKKMFIDFRRVVSQFAPNKRRRRGMGRKKGNGLLADIAIHDAEVGRVGASASVSASAPTPPVTRAPRGRKPLGATKGPASRRNAVQFESTPASTPTPEPESRPKRGRPPLSMSNSVSSRLAKTATPTPASTPAPSAPPSAAATPSVSAPPIIQIPAAPIAMTFVNIGTLASANMNAVPTLAAPVEEDETPEREAESRPMKKAKRTRKIKSAAMISEEPASPGLEAELPLPTTSANSASQNQQTPTRGPKKEKAALPPIQWSEEDKNLFLSLLAQYGDDFKRIAASMRSKTTIQVANYYKSNLVGLDLAKVAASAPKRSPTPELRDAWNELPFSAADAANSSMLTPPPVHAAPHQTPPMSSLSYDSSARSAYPPHTSYAGHTSPRDAAVPPPWTGPPLPTRMHHPPPPPPASQPTSFIARNMTGNNPSMDNRRHSTYNALPNRNGPYQYLNSTLSDPRGKYLGSSGAGSGKYPDGSGPPLPTRTAKAQTSPRPSSPPDPTRSPQGPNPIRSPVLGRAPSSSTSSIPMYATSSPPMPTNGRPGYVPPPLALPVSGPNATPIVHSPTGMSPKLPPHTPHTPTQAPATTHPVQPHAHGPQAQSHPTPHMGTYGGYPHPPASGHYPYGESRPRSGSTSSASGGWGQPRYYPVNPEPDGTLGYGVNRRRAESGSSDGPPVSGRREHGHTTYPYNPGAGGQGGPPSGGTASSPPGTISTRPTNPYYPGWTC